MIDLKEIKKKLDEYKAMFGDGFPTLCFQGSLSEMSDAIDRCLNEHKDAYDLNIVVIHDGASY